MFADRTDAGSRLGAAVLRAGIGRAERGRAGPGSAPRGDGAPAVIGLPRGGVVVGAQVAHALRAPLDVLVVRKLGHPRRPELGLGAVAEGGVRVLNDSLIARAGVGRAELDAVTARELLEVHRRVQRYRGDRPLMSLEGREVVIVDDGVATGYTVEAAVAAVRRRAAGRLVVAVPVSSAEPLGWIAEHVDEVVCLHVPSLLRAVGEMYADFEDTSDEEVVAALAAARP